MMSRMRGLSVRWHSGGHQLDPDSDVLRFEVADLNRVITRSVDNADLYRPLQVDRAHPADWQVLTLSCFAVTAAVILVAHRAADNTHLGRQSASPKSQAQTLRQPYCLQHLLRYAAADIITRSAGMR
jgi:hypothetical protein